MEMSPIPKDLEENKGQRILVLKVESSIAGEVQREHERSTNGSSSSLQSGSGRSAKARRNAAVIPAESGKLSTLISRRSME